MKRREFIKKAGEVAALATFAAADTGFLVSGCASDTPRTTGSKPDFEVPRDPRLPGITLARHEDHAEALACALAALGGIRRFVKPGERVLLKPNAAWNRVPEQAANTNPVLIGEMVRLCREAGAAEVLVTDFGAADPRTVFRRSGIRAAVEQNGGRLLILDDDDFRTDDFGGRFIGDWPALKHVFEIDRLVNMPIAKHHDLVLGTAAMKNFFGIIGGNRSALHHQLTQAIVDLAAYFLPTLTIVDATRVLMRNGPGGGSVDDVAVRNAVICATDQVAADSCAAQFLDRSGRDVPHVVLAHRQGLGEIDYVKAGFVDATPA